MSAPTQVTITPVPILGLLGCCVPVVPGTSRINAPMEERTELCAVDAHWIVGTAPTCDVHAEMVCEVADWSWPELYEEVGRTEESVSVPWGERQRHSQEDTRRAADRLAEQ